MKKLIYLSTIALLLALPGVAQADSHSEDLDDLTPSEIFCPLVSASDMPKNADDEIQDVVSSTYSGLSFGERKVLAEMDDHVDDDDTVRVVCMPEEG
jgi:hypothetical protein